MLENIVFEVKKNVGSNTNCGHEYNYREAGWLFNVLSEYRDEI